MTDWDSPPWDRTPEPDPDASTPAGLLEMLDAQSALLVDVATGGSTIDRVNPQYKRRRRLLNDALRARGLPAPFAFEDLWAWRGHWKAQGLDTYQSRDLPGYLADAYQRRRLPVLAIARELQVGNVKVQRLLDDAGVVRRRPGGAEPARARWRRRR